MLPCVKVTHPKQLLSNVQDVSGRTHLHVILPPFRWVLVQLLHWLKPERSLLPLWSAHKEPRWDHLVCLAWIHLLPQKSGDEGAASRFSSLGDSSVCPGSWSHAWMRRNLTNTFFLYCRRNENVVCDGLVVFQSDECVMFLPWMIVNCVFISKIFYF